MILDTCKIFGSCLSVLFLCCSQSEAIELCNKSSSSVFAAIADKKDSKWILSTTGEILQNECKEVGPATLSNRFGFRFQFKNKDQQKLAAAPGGDLRSFCVPHDLVNRDFVITEEISETKCREKIDAGYYPFGEMGRGEKDSCNIIIKPDFGVQQKCLSWVETIQMVKITTDVIYNKCLLRWDDSHQVHSSQTILEWNYQATKITMRKLEHCIRLKAVGPINVEGILKAHVDNCLQQSIESAKVKGIITLIAGLVADVYGAGGLATAAAVTDFVSNVSDKTVECIKDTNKLQETLANDLKQLFNASIKHEQEWIFWDL
jgi:uncharacterized membrane protein